MSALIHALPYAVAAIGQLRQQHQRRRLVERIARACGASRSQARQLAKHF